MTKFIKRLLLVCCSAALLVCGALFAACRNEETPSSGGEVSVAGQIVFESDDYDEYTREIKLSFTPNGTDVQGVSAELSYVNEEDETVTADGFTLARGENGYMLTDAGGKSYALDLAWGCADPKDDFAVLHGDFIVTDTIEDYEAHAEGSRHYIEEGYFGAGSLDVSGTLWYYYFEDMPHTESPYLRFYIEYDAFLDNTWDGTSARGDTWVNHECDDGNDYLVYYYIARENGARKVLFYDVQFFAADAETIDFHHYYGDFYFKNGIHIYTSDLIEESAENGTLTLFEKDAFEGVNGKLYARVYPRLALTYGNDGATDWMLYRFAGSEEEGGTDEFYFELDGDGNIKPETAQYGCRVWYQNTEKTWGYDAYYIAPSETEVVFKMLFGLGRVNGGKTEYFEDALIVKRADGEFTVYAEGGAWNVSLGLDEEAWKVTFDIEAAEEAAVAGEIVFDDDSERADHNFDEDITLRFAPVNGSADGAPATLIYEDGVGNSAVKGGFTLVAEGESGYLLRDGAGNEYAVDLVWSPEGTKNSVTVHGGFIADETIKDYEGAMNTAYHGYFGLDGVQVSHEMWWIQFGEVPRIKTKCLNVYNTTILDTPRYHDPAYGDLYAGYNYIPGDGGYDLEFYVTEKNGARCLLVKCIRYIPETLAWTTNFCEVNNGYEEGDGSIAITRSTILYSAKLFGLTKGMEIYTPYSDDTAHTPVRQLGYTLGTGINGEYDWMFLKDEEEGFLIHVRFDAHGNIDHVYDAYAGFVFDYMPDLSADLRYAVGAFFLSNAEDVYTPIKIYSFGYVTGGALYYPPHIRVEPNKDDTFTVNEVTDGGEDVIRQWKVSFTDLDAEVPVPHVAEQGEVLDYSLAFNWVYAETGASGKDADVFFVAPSSVTGREGQEILDFSYTSARRAFKGAIDMEKGIYDDNARFFAPYYRQAVLYDYSLEKAELEEYLAYAYLDVRNAFLYYMEHWNGGRPVILAGFSQGADHCIRLMKEFFGKTGEDGRKDLLVACYAIGWCITERELTENDLKFASDATGTGVIISFNTEAESITGSLTVPAGTKALCINPLNWTTDGTEANKSLNKGACFFDLNGNLLEIKEHLTGAYIDEKRGTLKVPDTDIDPEVYDNTLGGYVDEGVYHYYDYQFFYRNLKENVLARIAAYKAAHA